MNRQTKAGSKKHWQHKVLSAMLATAFGITSLPFYFGMSSAIAAETEASRTYDIPPGALDGALSRFAGEAGVVLSFEAQQAKQLRTKGLKGNYSIRQGFDTLLQGSGLQAVEVQSGRFTLKVMIASQLRQDAEVLPAVEVTVQSDALESGLMPAYAGGQVARGGRVGMLGNKDVMDTPFNISVYTSQLMRNQQAATMADVLDNDPAVRVSTRGRNTSVGGGDTFFIRGFTLTNRDISLNGLFGILPYGTLSTETVERVEVLKGPSALLNGMAPSGGVGGSINVVPKRASDIPLTRITTRYSSNSQWGSHVDVGRRWGEENQFGIRANVLYRDGDTAVAGQSARLVAGSLGLDFRGEKFRASLDIGHQTDDVRAGGVSYRFNALAHRAPQADSQLAQDWERRKFKDDYWATQLEYDLSPVWTTYFSMGGRDHRHTNLRTESTILDPAGNLSTTPTSYPESSQTKTLLAGTRIKFSALAAKHELNLAASTLKADAKFAYAWGNTAASNLYAPASIASPSLQDGFFDLRKAYDQRISSIGFADNLSWLDDTVQLMLGVRHQKIIQNNYDAWTPENPRTDDYEKSVNSPAAGIVIKPWSNTSLYANYIQGLSQGATAPADAENAGQTFPPIKTKQKELGIKIDFGRIMTTLALFELEQPNAITTAGNTTNSYRYLMDGEQRNRGVELSVTGEIISRVRVLSGMTYMQAKQMRTQDGTNDGKDASNLPRWIANAGLEWSPVLIPGLALNTRLLLTGHQYVDAANTMQLAGWTRWDIGARYETMLSHHPVTLRANILNVADRNYWESSAGSAGLLFASPRTLHLSAAIDF